MLSHISWQGGFILARPFSTSCGNQHRLGRDYRIDADFPNIIMIHGIHFAMMFLEFQLVEVLLLPFSVY